MRNQQLNETMDNFLRPVIHHQPTWRICVFGGMVLGIGLALALATTVGLSPWAAGGTALVGVLACGLIGLSKLVLTGVENYTFYHYQMGVLATTAVFLLLTHHPLLPYLDLIALALATALACGRWGCQAAGCCHGRPHKWGVCYPARPYHALGFTPQLLGVRLFPVQLAESLWLGVIVLTGGWMVWSGWPSGSVLAWYLVAYGCGRFCLEFWRGDEERPFWGSFSTAQWTSLVWLGGVFLAESTKMLPLVPWHLALAGGCLLLAAIISRPHYRTRREINRPHHVHELADILTKHTLFPGETVSVGCTSLGYLVSGGPTENNVYHYTISNQWAPITVGQARPLAALILQLRHPGIPGKLITGQHQTFHVLVNTTQHPTPSPIAEPLPMAVEVR